MSTDNYFDSLPLWAGLLFDLELGNQPYGGILTIAEYPLLSQLDTFVGYRGYGWYAIRKKVDQLDQVTVSRLK
jgi:hypothetical protein